MIKAHRVWIQLGVYPLILMMPWMTLGEMTYQGRLLDAQRNPIRWPFLKIHVRIFLSRSNPSFQDCIVWYEVHSLSTQNTRGFFSVPVGAGGDSVKAGTIPALSQVSDIWKIQQVNSCLDHSVPPNHQTLPSSQSVESARWIQIGVEKLGLDAVRDYLEWFPPERITAVPLASMSDRAKLADQAEMSVTAQNAVNAQFAQMAQGLSITPCSANQYLKWNGTKWICSPISFSFTETDPSTASWAKIPNQLGSTLELKGNSLNVRLAENSGLSASSSGLAVNVGIGPNQIVQLDGTGKLPALDASQLKNVDATRILGRTISSNAPNGGQVLAWNSVNDQWEPKSVMDIIGLGGITNSYLAAGISGSKIQPGSLPLDRLSLSSLTMVDVPLVRTPSGVNVAPWGRTSCPSDYTLIGTPGERSAFCISNTVETPPVSTYATAAQTCYNKNPRASICTMAEWVMACLEKQNNPSLPLTIKVSGATASDWEVVGESAGRSDNSTNSTPPPPTSSSFQSALRAIASTTSCGSAHLIKGVDTNYSLPVRCCLR